MPTITRDQRRKKTKLSHDKEMTTEQTGDDDTTVTATNRPARVISYKHVSYLKLGAMVQASKKGTATMKTKYQELFKTIQEADSDACLSIYKTDPDPDSSGKYIAQPNQIITCPTLIPESITAMSKFFFGSRPKSEGGVIWTQLRLLHNEPMENILADTKADFQEQGSTLTLQSIQHWDVAALGFLKNLHPDIDGENLERYLNEKLNCLHRPGDLTIGIRVKSPYDGSKRDPNKKIKFKDRVQAYHVDTIGEQRDTVKALLRRILESEEFATRYKNPVRLIPLYDRRSSPYTQEKIKRCIIQHNQYCQSVASLSCEGIPHLDTMIRPLKKTMRELILNLSESHFINIDLNWSGTNYCILYPRKYENEAKLKIAHLPAFLHRAYGDKIMSQFAPKIQEMIKDTTWNEQGQPISKIDRELDTIITEDDAIDFVDITYFAENEEISPHKASEKFNPRLTEAPVPFVPEMDQYSVSTFGTAASKSPRKLRGSPAPSKVGEDSGTVDSSVSMVSRVSKVESDIGDVKQMLQRLVAAHCSSKTPPAQRSCDKQAELSQGDSARGV